MAIKSKVVDASLKSLTNNCCKLKIFVKIMSSIKYVSDVDECTENSTICESGKFCDNTPGSYACRGTV